MTLAGILAACAAAAGVSVLVIGTFAALALNSVPLAAAVTGTAFTAMGLLGAWARLRRRFRFPPARPLTGWRRAAAALLSLACGAGAVAAGFLRLATWTAVLVVLAAALGVRCAMARRPERECPRDDSWTNEDREWLLLNGAALPEAQERQR